MQVELEITQIARVELKHKRLVGFEEQMHMVRQGRGLADLVAQPECEQGRKVLRTHRAEHNVPVRLGEGHTFVGRVVRAFGLDRDTPSGHVRGNTDALGRSVLAHLADLQEDVRVHGDHGTVRSGRQLRLLGRKSQNGHGRVVEAARTVNVDSAGARTALARARVGTLTALLVDPYKEALGVTLDEQRQRILGLDRVLDELVQQRQINADEYARARLDMPDVERLRLEAQMSRALLGRVRAHGGHVRGADPEVNVVDVCIQGLE